MERTYGVPSKSGQVSIGDVCGELRRIDDVGATSSIFLNISIADEWVMLAVEVPEPDEKLIKET